MELICPHCRGDAEKQVLGEVLGRYGNARVRITDLPVLKCTYCEKSAPSYSEFIADSVRILAGISDMPAARLVGLFRKQPGCCRCKAVLQGAETEPVGFPADLDLTDPPFHCDLSILATICPSCETRQVVHKDSSLERDIALSIQRALESVSVTLPPGYSGVDS